jgi:hypothetical protein
MTTTDETKSLNTMMMKVKAMETARLLAHSKLWAARTFCYAKQYNVEILSKQSKQNVLDVWYSKDSDKTDMSLVQTMWQTGIELDNATHILNNAKNKVVIVEDKLVIAEAKKKEALDAFIEVCNSTADLLFNDNKKHFSECYPEVDLDEIKTFLPNLLRRRTEYPDNSKCDIIGCLCDESPCKTRHSNYITEMMTVCKPHRDDCSICLDPLTLKPCVMTSCNHTFHRSCMFKLENTHKFPLCPLCRKHISVVPHDSDKDNFLQLKKCKCCERHKRKRPHELSSKAVISYQCSNPRADILMELLRCYDNSIRNPKCNCNCRKQMRLYCRSLSDKVDVLDTLDDEEW